MVANFCFYFLVNVLCVHRWAFCVRRGLSRPTASKSPASFSTKPYNYIICIFDRIIGFSGKFRFSRPDKVLHRLLDIASQLGDPPNTELISIAPRQTWDLNAYSSPLLTTATASNNTHSRTVLSKPNFHNWCIMFPQDKREYEISQYHYHLICVCIYISFYKKRE